MQRYTRNPNEVWGAGPFLVTLNASCSPLQVTKLVKIWQGLLSLTHGGAAPALRPPHRLPCPPLCSLNSTMPGTGSELASVGVQQREAVGTQPLRESLQGEEQGQLQSKGTRVNTDCAAGREGATVGSEVTCIMPATHFCLP